MTIKRTLDLLKIEHECMSRGANDDCDRDCASCDIVQDCTELNEMYVNVINLTKYYMKRRSRTMERIDEIIEMLDKAECPKAYKQCPLFKYNDCDNYCPFVEASDMLKEYRELINAKEVNVDEENG